MPSRKPHIHKYHKIDIGSFRNHYYVYACAVPNCTHYVPVDRAVGKTTRCVVCDKPYEITKADTRYVRIACKNCKGKRVRNPEIRERMEQNKETQVEAIEILDVLMNLGDIE